MATLATIRKGERGFEISLGETIKPWEVKCRENAAGEPEVIDVAPGEAAFREELMWQDK
jgi:hypothetical protein